MRGLTTCCPGAMLYHKTAAGSMLGFGRGAGFMGGRHRLRTEGGDTVLRSSGVHVGEDHWLYLQTARDSQTHVAIVK